MIISDRYKQFLDLKALIIVAAKERGIIYRVSDGTIEMVSQIENHPPTRSDDEGFFFKSGGPGVMGGAPKEEDDEVYTKQLDRQLAKELDTLIESQKSTLLYIFEPEHLKGRVERELQQHPHLSIHTVRYGNYVNESPEKIVSYINDYIEPYKVKDDEESFKKDRRESS